MTGLSQPLTQWCTTDKSIENSNPMKDNLNIQGSGKIQLPFMFNMIQAKYSMTIIFQYG